MRFLSKYQGMCYDCGHKSIEWWLIKQDLRHPLRRLRKLWAQWHAKHHPVYGPPVPMSVFDHYLRTVYLDLLREQIYETTPLFKILQDGPIGIKTEDDDDLHA